MQYKTHHNELNLGAYQTISFLKTEHRGELEIEHLQIRHKATFEIFLLKKIIKSRNPKILEPIMQEFSLLKGLNHPSIIRCYSCKETDNEMYLLYEFMERDLGSEYKNISEPESAMIILQIADALEYIHSQSTLHRNVNLSNIMISGSGLEIKAKLTNFEHAGPVMSSGTIKTESIDSLAPEILDNQLQNQKADVWGLGVVMYALYCKSHPFSGNLKMSQDFVKESIKRCVVVYPKTTPSMIKHLLEKIFILSPLLRLTVIEIVSHQYFKQYKQKQEEIRQKQYLEKKVLDLQQQLQVVKSSQFKSKDIIDLQQRLKMLEDQYKSALQIHDFQRQKLKQTEVKCIKLQKQKRTLHQYRMNLDKSKLQLSKINNNIILVVQQNKKIQSRTKQLEVELNFLKNKQGRQEKQRPDKVERSNSNRSSSSISKHIINEKLKQLRGPRNSSKGKVPPLKHSKSSKIIY